MFLKPLTIVVKRLKVKQPDANEEEEQEDKLLKYCLK